MKQLLTKHLLAIIVSLSAASASAEHLKADVRLRVNEPCRTVSVSPRPFIPAVRVSPPPVVYPHLDRARFIYADRLGFYVAVGVPYDLCYLEDGYYLFSGGRWLKARSSRGPWLIQSFRSLPQVLRNQKVERIRDYREAARRSSDGYLRVKYIGVAEMEQHTVQREQWPEREERGQRADVYREYRRPSRMPL